MVFKTGFSRWAEAAGLYASPLLPIQTHEYRSFQMRALLLLAHFHHISVNADAAAAEVFLRALQISKAQAAVWLA